MTNRPSSWYTGYSTPSRGIATSAGTGSFGPWATVAGTVDEVADTTVVDGADVVAGRTDVVVTPAVATVAAPVLLEATGSSSEPPKKLAPKMEPATMSGTPMA